MTSRSRRRLRFFAPYYAALIPSAFFYWWLLFWLVAVQPVAIGCLAGLAHRGFRDGWHRGVADGMALTAAFETSNSEGARSRAWTAPDPWDYPPIRIRVNAMTEVTSDDAS